MSELRYNFVFFFARYDFWRSVFGEELYHNKHVRIYKEAFSGSKILQKIFHYHWAYSINQKICLPFKKIWFRKMYTQDFEEDLPIVFIYLAGGTIYYGKEFLKYVKEKNQNNMNVALYADLCGKDHELLKNIVDLEVTYDEGEAKKYGIEHFRKIIYSKQIPEPDKPEFEYDVYFLGAAKDRLPKINEIYKYLIKNGLKCKFIVAGAPKEKQIEGIEYTSGITYVQNLQYVIKSKCLLEITQGGSSDATMRAREAVAYRRKFLTDCKVDLSEFFHENQLNTYNTVKDISMSFLKEEFSPDDFNPKANFDPMQRLYFIQNKLENRK